MQIETLHRKPHPLAGFLVCARSRAHDDLADVDIAGLFNCECDCATDGVRPNRDSSKFIHGALCGRMRDGRSELGFHHAWGDYGDADLCVLLAHALRNGNHRMFGCAIDGRGWIDSMSSNRGNIHDLPEALRTGKPQNEEKHGQKGIFETLYAEPAKLEQFMGAMTGLSRINFEAFAARFDFSKFKSNIYRIPERFLDSVSLL